MILVEDIGQNRIVLAPGANGTLSPSDMDACVSVLQQAAMLIVQLEVPLPVVQRAMEIAHAAGVPVLLNPGPAVPLPDSWWSKIDILVPNETEASLLSGIAVNDVDSAFSAARVLRQRGVANVLITLGANGVISVNKDGEHHHPAHVVKAVDTTAAGDTFIGGLAAGLALLPFVGDDAGDIVVTASHLIGQRGLMEIGHPHGLAPGGQGADMIAHRMRFAIVRAVDVIHRPCVVLRDQRFEQARDERIAALLTSRNRAAIAPEIGKMRRDRLTQ